MRNGTMLDGTLVKVTTNEHTFSFRLVSREHYEHHRFLVLRPNFLNWLASGMGECFLAEDLGNFLQAHVYQDIVTMTITWLSCGNDRNVRGFRQTVALRRSELLPMLEAGGDRAFLSYEGHFDSPIRYDFSRANRTLKKVIDDPLKRRALSKELRSRLTSHYPRSITLYNDFRDSFFMRCQEGDFEYSAGLVLHESKKDGHPSRYYSLHT